VQYGRLFSIGGEIYEKDGLISYKLQVTRGIKWIK
jgi:hypothetical protein